MSTEKIYDKIELKTQLIHDTKLAQDYLQTSLVTIISRVITICSCQNKQDMTNKLNNLRLYIESLSDYYDKAFGRYHFDETKRIKKGYRIIYNHCLSLSDLCESDELTEKDIRQFKRKQEARCLKLKTLILLVSEKVVNKRIEKHDHDANLSTVDKDPFRSHELVKEDPMKILQHKAKETSGRSINDILKEAEPFLKGLNQYKNKLPTSVDRSKPFVIKRFPIIALFKNALTAEELEEAGFSVKKVGPYTVLLNQLVVGENKSPVRQRVVNKTRSGSKTKVVLEDMKKLSSQDILDAVITRLGKKAIVMQKTIGTSNNFKWYWIVPESQVLKLTAKNKHFNVRDWSFAFNH